MSRKDQKKGRLNECHSCERLALFVGDELPANIFTQCRDIGQIMALQMGARVVGNSDISED